MNRLQHALLALAACALLLPSCSLFEDDEECSPFGDGLTLLVVEGDNQWARPNNSLPMPVRVKVVNHDLLNVPGIEVHFSVTGGGGSVSETAALTDEEGNAQTMWTLGAEGYQRLRASVTGSDGVDIAGSPRFLIANIEITPCETAYHADGKAYEVVRIGGQCWLKQNLSTAVFANGDPVPHIEDAFAWSALDMPAWCTYGGEASNDSLFGKLYNWQAVADERNLCPYGWRVATDEDYTILTGFLEGEATAGGKLKERDTLHWSHPNSGATNASGFSARGGGLRDTNGDYYDLRNLGIYWTSTSSASDVAWSRYLYANAENTTRLGANKRRGQSVRCIAD